MGHSICVADSSLTLDLLLFSFLVFLFISLQCAHMINRILLLEITVIIWDDIHVNAL